MTINKNNNPTEWERLFLGRNTSYIHGPGTPVQPLDTIYLLGSKDIVEDNKRPRVAIVGTRDISPYGRFCTERIVQALSVNPLKPVIVSGLAYGVDACAHMSALLFALPTVAVMPTGLDTIYPLQHRQLAERILKNPGSCLLTQFPEGTAPEPYNFLHRNHVTASICDAVIVVESKAKGGSMVTARFAHKRGIPVYAVPGRIDDIRSFGCNELLSSGVARIISNFNQLSDKNFFKSRILFPTRE